MHRAEICYVARDLLYAFCTSHGWGTSARVHVRIRFYLGNQWTQRAGILRVVRNSLNMFLFFTKTWEEGIRMCALQLRAFLEHSYSRPLIHRPVDV